MSLSPQGIAGTGISGKREQADFYPTPPLATEALFRMEKFDGSVWEPASGNGAMSVVIEKYNPCVSSDIRTNDFKIYGECGVDFLTQMQGRADNIITNPPFKFALEFVEQAKKLATKKIAMLLKLNFLESAGRYQMFKDQDFPLASVYVFSKRLNFFPATLEKTAASGVLAYAWYVWDKDHKGKAVLDWIM